MTIRYLSDLAVYDQKLGYSPGAYQEAVVAPVFSTRSQLLWGNIGEKQL